MFIVLLKFSTNRSRARELMPGHKEWLKRGFDEGIFLLAGSLEPDLGGGILADNTSLEALQNLVKDDPFVVENVVSPEILELSPGKAADPLNFLVRE